MDISTLVWIGGIGGVLWIGSIVWTQVAKANFAAEFAGKRGLTPENVFVGQELVVQIDTIWWGLGWDQSRNHIVLARRSPSGALQFLDIPASSIASVGVFCDEVSVSETTRGSALARAAGLGVLTGGAGAIVGAISASSRTVAKSSFKSAGLKITTDLPRVPLCRIYAFKQDFGEGLSGSLARMHLDELEKWEAIVAGCIRRAASSSGDTRQRPPDAPTLSQPPAASASGKPPRITVRICSHCRSVNHSRADNCFACKRPLTA